MSIVNTFPNLIRNSFKQLISLIKDKDTGVYINVGCHMPDSTPSLSIDDITKSKKTLLIDCNEQAYTYTSKYYQSYSNVTVSHILVTPENIQDTVISKIEPYSKEVHILDIDIDSYDYFLAKELTQQLKPNFLVVEINEKIPPPIKFAVLYEPETTIKIPDGHFFGASLSQMCTLKDIGYDPIQLFFNTLIFIKKEINPFHKTPEQYKMFRPRTDIELYETQYLKPKLHELVDYNQDVLHWQNNNPETTITEINKFFSKYKNHYILKL